MSDCYLNQHARIKTAPPGLFAADEYAQVSRFFDSRTDLIATPLQKLSGLATRLGVGQLLAKDETSRFGLPAFKISGISFTIERLLRTGAINSMTVLTAATAGNHGRALAHAARQHGLRTVIFVPSDAAAARVNAIRNEGAEVIRSSGNYDVAVREAAEAAAVNDWLVVSDTAWPGYEQIPHWIKLGYTRLIAEAARQWPKDAPPDVVLVQGGVGGLVCATLSWLCFHYGQRRPYFIVCEPAGSACLLAAARAGQPVTLADTAETLMECLRCGAGSSIALPIITNLADAFLAIDDEWCKQAMRLLADPTDSDPAIAVGASGACGLAGLLSLTDDESFAKVRATAGINSESRVLIFLTEGITDPDLYARIVTMHSPVLT